MISTTYKKIVEFIKDLYPGQVPVPLHAPVFLGNEKKYLNECIDSTYVSYVGEYVAKFENRVCEFIGVKHAVAMVNGTTALQIALIIAGVKPGEEVLTQALTFVATANAIKHSGADPIFIDSEKETLGMSPDKLQDFIEKNTVIKKDGYCYNRRTHKKISACVAVHVFGHPVRIDEIVRICNKYNIKLIEDAAESLGSTYNDKHTGTFGTLGILSFNGNKIVTTGGGGMIITNNNALADKARHIASTAKCKHKWEYVHDEIGYNYRMPNVNAAIGYAQMEKLDYFLKNKRELAHIYENFFSNINMKVFMERRHCKVNYWLNTIILNSENEKDDFLKFTNVNDVQTRPVWKLLNKLPMYQKCQTDGLENAIWLEKRLINIPSGVRI